MTASGPPVERSFEIVGCRNDGCWVGEYRADANGAINITDRYRSGESHRRSDRTSRQKAGNDDSATDGAVRETESLVITKIFDFRTTSLTGPQGSQADAENQQTTLGTYAS